MKMHSVKSQIAGLAAAAVILGAAAFFGVHFFRSVPKKIPERPVLEEISDFVPIGGTNDSGHRSTSDEKDTSDNSSEIHDDNDVSDKSGEESNVSHDKATADSHKHDGSSERVSDGSDKTPTDDKSTEKVAANDIHSDYVPDGTKTQGDFFTTSIKDGETVSDSNYSFTITQLNKSLTLRDIHVYVGGNEILQFAGKCRLSEGENTIRVACSYTDSSGKVIRVYKDYTVILKTSAPTKAPDNSNNTEQFGLDTDLADRTVYDENYSFYARLTGADDNAKITVKLKNVKLDSHNGQYSCKLDYGENIIRVAGRNGSGESFSHDYTVNCYPPVAEEDKPVLDSINVYDGFTVKGSAFSLSLYASDKDGNRIYSDKITLSVNGNTLRSDWEDDGETGYILPLNAGENSLMIRLSDGNGRTADYYYVINSQSVSQGEEIGRVSISLSGELVGLYGLCTDDYFPIYEGESGADAVCRFLSDNGFEADLNPENGYISRISKSGAFGGAYLTDSAREYALSQGISQTASCGQDSLGEYDFTQGSGWVYMRNGEVPSYGMNGAVFGDGDIICLKFTVAYGNDIRDGLA